MNRRDLFGFVIPVILIVALVASTYIALDSKAYCENQIHEREDAICDAYCARQFTSNPTLDVNDLGDLQLGEEIM